MTLLKNLRVIIAFSILLSGCRKPTSANWDVDMVLPVVNCVLNVKNFLGDSIFRTDNTGLLYLSLNKEVASLKLDSLLRLPDTTLVQPFTNTLVPFSLTHETSFPFLTAPEDFEFSISDGIRLKKVEIRQGTLFVKFSNSVAQPLDLLYTLPGVTKNGVPFVIAETIPTGTNSLSKSYDLSGYTFSLRGKSGKDYNSLSQTYSLSLTPGASTVFVNLGDGATIDLNYSKIIPQYIEGDFAEQSIELPADTAKFGIIGNFKASNFMLSDATMDFTILNEFGAEFSANLTNIKSINSATNKIVDLKTNQLASINLNAASKVGTAIYPDIKFIPFNAQNSNIVEFISNLPDEITYKGNVKLNPNHKDVATDNNFAFYNTGIRIMANINIPMRFTGDYFQLVSNAAVNFSNLTQLKNVNDGYFVVKAKNGYPFTAVVQAYMLDREKQVIDSLFIPGSNRIEKAMIDPLTNIVISPIQSDLRIPIDHLKIERLQECKSIKIVSTFIMPPNNPPEIKLFESYEFAVKIIAELNYHVGVKSQ